MNKNFSFYILIFCYLILSVTFFYFPKCTKGGTEATLSWDVSGYYTYLPAVFIYKDIKKLSFLDQIIETYHPTPYKGQGYKVNNGNYVCKYSIGQSIMYLPSFLIGHLYAKVSKDHPPDGFSKPYQYAISIGSLMVAFLSLFFVQKLLLLFFSQWAVGISLVMLCLGSNYLNYAAIDNAMTHNYLFLLYTLLLLKIIEWYKNPNVKTAWILGLICGLMTLTRPTELISIILILVWGLDFFSRKEIKLRFQILSQNWKSIIVFAITLALVGFLQLAYWKFVAGEWLVYSYQEQGFSFFDPHLFSGIFSYNNGWLVYSPMMAFSIIGFLTLLIKRKREFFAIAFFTGLFIYIAFSWDIWWYGGSLGQRTMVQLYPILLFPMASLMEFLHKRNIYIKGFIYILIIGTASINLWFTHQAHIGGQFYSEQMTKAYYWKSLFNTKPSKQNVKLLDTESIYEGEIPYEAKVHGPFLDTIVLESKQVFSKEFNIEWQPNHQWVRIYATLLTSTQESVHWKMAQMVCSFKKNNGDLVYSTFIRPQRLLTQNIAQEVYMDVQIPKESFDKANLYFWLADDSQTFRINNIYWVLF